jgi:phosphoenolpyruvate carboxykinase (ATP)
MPLRFTRAIIDAIHSGELRDAPVAHDPVLNLDVVTQCSGVPAEMLQPRLAWRSEADFVEAARKLSDRFRANFEKYTSQVAPEVVRSGPGETY